MKLLLVFLSVAVLLSTVICDPVGATVTAGTPVTLGTQSAGTAHAWGGNITQVNLTINSSTLHWQGFFGSITASLRLASGAEGSVNTMKVWPVSTVAGQVYVSQSNNINFSALNTTATTLSNVDSAFTFLSSASDSAINTGTNSANPAFNISTFRVSANTRPLITTLNSSGSSVWRQVVMKHGASNTPSNFVFVGLINSSGVAYDGNPAHYQVIVPENSVGDTASSTYYFYGEVQ